MWYQGVRLEKQRSEEHKAKGKKEKEGQLTVAGAELSKKQWGTGWEYTQWKLHLGVIHNINIYSFVLFFLFNMQLKAEDDSTENESNCSDFCIEDMTKDESSLGVMLY